MRGATSRAATCLVTCRRSNGCRSFSPLRTIHAMSDDAPSSILLRNYLTFESITDRTNLPRFRSRCLPGASAAAAIAAISASRVFAPMRYRRGFGVKFFHAG
jgi:hypothetical protein